MSCGCAGYGCGCAGMGAVVVDSPTGGGSPSYVDQSGQVIVTDQDTTVARGAALLILGLSAAGTVVGAYHGFKRNNSVGWALVWGILGGLAPIITIPVAFAQGISKAKPGARFTANVASRIKRARRAKRWHRVGVMPTMAGAKRLAAYAREPGKPVRIRRLHGEYKVEKYTRMTLAGI